ncbi:MAG: NAD-dependent epimerase/dehydratase family protein [Anaerolineae bacterium]|nr:NAD-dependent epimerase/dehydratase family protein [Anaerolineae bacterium]
MARYLLAGAAGFIAARVAEMLLDDGHTVLGVDNMNSAYDVRMKEYRLERLQARKNFSFQKLDISDRQGVADLGSQVSGYDAVINLAARAGVRASVEDPWVYVDTNMTGTLNLLEICRQHDIPKFLLASTSSIYGQDAPLPTPETADSSAPLQPYAASKKGAEAMAHAYHFLHGIDVTIVRYFTVYGPAARPDMVMFRFAQWISEGLPVKLNGDGEQTRGFTYVDDIARGTILGLKPLGFEVINLGGHESISINDLIAMLEQLVGRKANIEHLPFHKADMTANHANVEKAGELLGWEPQISLKEGLARLVDWYNTERQWASQIDTE